MGADYKSARKGFLQLHCHSQLVAGATNYFGNNGLATGVEINNRIRVPTACTLRNMSIRLDAAPVGAETVTFTIFVNGIAGNQTLVITGADRGGVDAINTDVLGAADNVSVRAVSSGAAVAVRANVVFEVVNIG